MPRWLGLNERLDESWLNDAAKAFVPAGAGYEEWRALSHLTVATVDAGYAPARREVSPR